MAINQEGEFECGIIFDMDDCVCVVDLGISNNSLTRIKEFYPDMASDSPSYNNTVCFFTRFSYRLVECMDAIVATGVYTIGNHPEDGQPVVMEKGVTVVSEAFKRQVLCLVALMQWIGMDDFPDTWTNSKSQFNTLLQENESFKKMVDVANSSTFTFPLPVDDAYHQTFINLVATTIKSA